MRYVAHFTTSVDELQSKFGQLSATVDSGDFISDPQPTTFRLKLIFKGEYLSAVVKPVDRDLTFHGIKVEVSDRDGDFFHATVKRKSKKIELGRVYHFLLLEKGEIPNIETEFKIDWYLEYVVTPTETPNAESADSDVLSAYWSLFESGQWADLTILVQGEKIMAHKAFLVARSEYFARMYQPREAEGGTFAEVDTNTIQVPDVKPAIYRQMLQYIYTGKEPDYSEEETKQLLVAADKYGVEALKKTCESLLSLHLSTETVIDTMLLADQHNCGKLLRHTFLFFKMHCTECKKHAKFRELRNNPDLLLQLASCDDEIVL